MADLPKCERQLGVYAISLDGLRVHVDYAPQHGRIVSGEGYLTRGQIQGQHAIGRCFLIDALSAELIPKVGSVHRHLIISQKCLNMMCSFKENRLKS